jgi:DNA-binding GntR family transcriptional regulator
MSSIETEEPTGNELQRPVPLFETIYELIWAALLDGRLKPGSRVKDIDWARRLSVSRTPVREAMRRLQLEGILVPVAQGYEVKTVTANDLTNLYLCRASLERTATQQAASRATPEDVARLRNVIAACDEAIAAKDFPATFELNTRFHDMILALAGNSYLVTVYGLVKRHIIFARKDLLTSLGDDDAANNLYKQRLARKQAQHRAIVKAISAHDSVQAGDLMEEHLLDSSKHFQVR